ncbi:5567_t:CDS:10 [Dentiscutata erythropus]|uniref:5567_t:CDS:1 n=1 Tax=Dentiscutata erythropus TaxID=1348616 RepID=A0A9N8YZJ4_9GLOM|nr:5567_t:CDS:10 [Dentiscutata erythropus]
MLTRSKRGGKRDILRASQRDGKKPTSKVTRMTRRKIFILTNSSDEDQISEEAEELKPNPESELETEENLDFQITTRSKRRMPRINYSDEKYYSSRFDDNNGNSKRKAKEFSDDEIEKKRIKPSKRIISNRRKISRRANTYGDSSEQKRRSLRTNLNVRDAGYYEGSSNSDDNDESEPSESNESSDQGGRSNIKKNHYNVSSDESDNETITETPDASDEHVPKVSVTESEVEVQYVQISDPIPSYQILRKDDPEFIEKHIWWCNKCGDNKSKGTFVYCGKCSVTYHRQCYQLRPAVVNSIVECKYCIENNAMCIICHKSSEDENQQLNKSEQQQSDELSVNKGDGVNEIQQSDKEVNSDEQQPKDMDNNEEDAMSSSSSTSDPYPNLLFRCNRCSLTMHERCLPALNEDDSPELTIELYRERWNCHLCDRWSWEIDKILTYRFISEKSGESSILDESNTLMKASEIEVLVKFKDRSYRKVEWVPGYWLMNVSVLKYRYFVKTRPVPLSEEEVIPREWLKIHRVLDVEYSNNKTLREKLSSRKSGAGVETMKRAFIKWKGLRYIESTWEDISDLDGKKFAKALKIRRKAYKIDVMDRFVDRSFQEIKKQPSWLSNNPKYQNKLMDYQLDGIKHDRHCYPFIVVAPKSTTAGWSREFKRWAPNLVVVEFHGDKESCEIVEKYEMFPDDSSLKCHVLITTPETVLFRSRVLSKVRMWEVMVVDEAHSLKGGDERKVFRQLNSTLKNVFYKILLTGTPLMNSIDELFNLLHFLGHEAFKNPKELAEQYQGLPSLEQLPALHKLLKNYFLRRTKSQVNIELPPMDDVIVRVSMTAIQKKIYKETFEKNAEFLREVTRARKSTGFSNILMGLRQIVCHPYLINREVDIREDPEKYDSERRKMLVESSGKLIMLRDMLRKLHDTKHRVLIFSQFVEMLSILEEFCEDEGYSYVKLDGSTSNEVRQENISAFQAPDKNIFIFLLSTRAGGVGLNLMAADTVFIFDPDFNPHQDIQALSRVHRIGQYKPVKVFRFITQFSVEERIVEKGKIKLAKNELVVEKMDDEILDVEEVDDIIRCGVKALFSEDANEKPIGIYTDETIEKLLDRSQMKAAEKKTDSKNLTGFASARVWDTENQVIVDDIKTGDRDRESKSSNDFWDKILAHVAKSSTVVPIEGRGARKRNKVNYYEGDYSSSSKKQKKKQITTTDLDFEPSERIETSSESSSDELEDEEDLGLAEDAKLKPGKNKKANLLTPVKVNENGHQITTVSESGNSSTRQSLSYSSDEIINVQQNQLTPVSEERTIVQPNPRYIAPAYNQKSSESPTLLNVQRQQQYYAQMRMQQYYRQMQMRRQGYSGYPVEIQPTSSLMNNSPVNSSGPVIVQSVQPHLVAVGAVPSQTNMRELTNASGELQQIGLQSKGKATDVASVSGSDTPNPNKPMINHFMMIFDKLQKSQEDVTNRLIALIRVYHELQRLEFDIEKYIATQSEKNQLDKALMAAFRQSQIICLESD